MSVYIVSFNSEDYIKRAIESVLMQEGDFELEIIVSDDGSTDNTKKIVEDFYTKYPKIIRTYFHKNNRGANKNVEFAIKACAGDFICHLDADDYYLEGKIQTQLIELIANEDCLMAVHNMQVCYKDGSKSHLYYKNTKGHKGDFKKILRYGSGFCNSSNMFRRNVINDNCPKLDVEIVGDWLLTLQKLVNGKIYYSNKVLGVYYRHDKSLVRTSNNKISTVLEDYIKTINWAAKLDFVDDDDIHFAKQRIYFERSIRFLEKKDFFSFSKYIELSKKHAKNNFFVNFVFLLRRFPRLILIILKFRRLWVNERK